MILITGATGTIGRALTRELLSRGAPVRAMTREPAKALLDARVHVVRGDFGDEASLRAALDGITTLFLLSAPGPALREHDDAMLAATLATKVEKIVKLSAYGTSERPSLKASQWHLAGEQAVMESGRAWSILRPGAFASNARQWTASIRAGGAIEVATGDGKHGVVDPRDVSAVAAEVLLSRTHDGKSYTLTGPEALSTPEQVTILGRELGRAIEVRRVSVDAAVEKARTFGVPQAFLDAMGEGFALVRDGLAAELSQDVERVLGRAPRTFADWARDHRFEFS